MDKRYLTISEFAKLRNVSLGSLHYYEKLNILIPAYVDPETKYRYYLPEQLGTLDAILLCITLGIPLKDFKSYIDEDGYLDGKRLLTNGEKAMQAKISEMQKKLQITRITLESMERNQQYNKIRGVYKREIEERYFIESYYRKNIKNLTNEERKQARLFIEAQKSGDDPVFPSGIILHYEKEVPDVSFFFRVLDPDDRDKRIVRIPKGIYSCMQVDLTPQTDLQKLLDEHFPERSGKMIIISNMLTNRMHFDSRHSEIQMLDGQ